MKLDIFILKNLQTRGVQGLVGTSNFDLQKALAQRAGFDVHVDGTVARKDTVVRPQTSSNAASTSLIFSYVLRRREILCMGSAKCAAKESPCIEQSFLGFLAACEIWYFCFNSYLSWAMRLIRRTPGFGGLNPF